MRSHKLRASLANASSGGGGAGGGGDDISSAFVEISNRIIESDTVMGSGDDYDGDYDVAQVQTDFTGSGRVYIAVKTSASGASYMGDVAIAGVQIISGSTLVRSWIFNTSTGGSGSGWQTKSGEVQGTNPLSAYFSVTPATASGYTYQNITSTADNAVFSWATSTGSSYTGAADGIGDTYKLSADGGSNTLAPVGNAQISQASNSYYAYREGTGSSEFSAQFMRSPAYTFSGGEYIRVIHICASYSLLMLHPNDTLYVAVK